MLDSLKNKTLAELQNFIKTTLEEKNLPIQNFTLQEEHPIFGKQFMSSEVVIQSILLPDNDIDNVRGFAHVLSIFETNKSPEKDYLKFFEKLANLLAQNEEA